MTAVAIMIAVGLISYFSDISLVLQIFKFHLDAPYVLMQKFSQLLNAVCFSRFVNTPIIELAQ